MQGWWLASYVALWLLVIGLCIVVVALARQIGTLHLRLGPRGALQLDDEGPPLGEPVEEMIVTDASGRATTIGGRGHRRLLVFVSPGCMVCEQVLPAIPAVARAGRLEALIVTDVDATETRIAYARHRKLGAPVVSGVDVAQAYGVPGTPYAVVLDRDAVVRAKGTINNLEQLEGLVDGAAGMQQEKTTEGSR